MAKMSLIGTLIESEHVKASKTSLKSSRQLFCHIFLSVWKNFSSKNSFLVVSEVLRLFHKLWTHDHKYSLSIKVSVSYNQFKCNYLQNPRNFWFFSSNFDICIKLWTFYKKKAKLMVDLFSKLLPAKCVVS